MAALDTGAHLLAATGLLAGYTATLHWENAPAFAERYPLVRLTSNIFEFDRNRVTCAGGTAVIDLILHAIAQDHGPDFAIRVAEHLMHPRRRQPHESQRMEISHRFQVFHPKISRAIQLMESHMEDPMPADTIAQSVGLSSRQLARLFNSQTGSSPHAFYLKLRLDQARRLLLHSDLSVTEIAVACGFPSPAHFSRVYRTAFSHPPRKERAPRQTRPSLIMDTPLTKNSRRPEAP